MPIYLFYLGELNVNLVNDRGVNVPLQVNDNEDGSFLIDYVPTSTGVHSLNCTYGGVKVPVSPIKINVQSPVDVSKVKVDGLEPRKLFESIQSLRPCLSIPISAFSVNVRTRVVMKINRTIRNNYLFYDSEDHAIFVSPYGFSNKRRR